MYFILFFLLSSWSSAFELHCMNCKFYLENKLNPKLSCCKMFKNITYEKGKEKIIYDYVDHCRKDENLCGKEGFLYEENILEKEKKIIDEKYEELNNRCCGEVNEQYELEQLEREFLELFQKMKRYNSKKILKTTKDIYKLFKRN